MKRVDLSETTLERLLKEYPHLTDGDIQEIFNNGRLIRNNVTDAYIMADACYLFEVLPSVVERTNIDTLLYLVPDNEGTLYTITHDIGDDDES